MLPYDTSAIALPATSRVWAGQKTGTAKVKFIGRRDQVRLYSNADSLRKQPQTGRKWQDSAWLNWWDVKNKVGGIHRIGHEYNWEEGPRVAAWTNLVTPAGIYKHVVHLPLREEDKRATGWGGGDDVCRVDFDANGDSVWTIDDPSVEVSAALRFKDFHEAFNGFPNSGRTAEDIAPSHIDVAGSITGTISMQGGVHRAEGMGVRDHGWGFRDIGTMRSHRYVSATFGREFSFVSWAIHNAHDTIEIFGWVIKGDTVIFPKDIDILAYAEIDSCSVRGGRITFTLPDDEVLECELIAEAPGLQNFFHNLGNNNTLCRAVCNGKVGSGQIETSMNYYEGRRPAGRMQRALSANGFYPGSFELKGDVQGEHFIPKRTL
jgi:hypothetical protein